MKVGEGNVVLIAGGGEIYADVAGRFVGSKRSLEEIIASDYNKNIVKNIINAGHEAALEFDYFIFGVEGYSRVSEAQLIRKRLASYMIKSGRIEKGGERDFSVVLPEGINNFRLYHEIEPDSVTIESTNLGDILINDDYVKENEVKLSLNAKDILNIIEAWYNRGVELGYKEEDLRYLKPQATEFKAIVAMNAHALRDWFRIRCCKNAQTEIRDMATKMLRLSKEAAPDLFKDAGPNCVRMGYCPENKMQHEDCNIITKDEMADALGMLDSDQINHLF